MLYFIIVIMKISHFILQLIFILYFQLKIILETHIEIINYIINIKTIIQKLYW